jgi:ATP-dependent Clp protease ATP-binding subunit ClpB
VALFGFDKIYGARPVKRVLQNKIEDELALQIIEGKLKPGMPIKISFVDGKLNIE